MLSLETDKLVLKFIWKYKGLRRCKTTLKRRTKLRDNNYLTTRLNSSVTQSCPTLCDPTYCSTPDFPVHHQLPELTQTHVPSSQ